MGTPQNPSFPYDKCAGHMCQQYSYLSYVTTTTDAEIPSNASCALNTTGMTQVRGLPNGSLLAMGALGKYMIVVPEEKLVVVAFGSNVAHLDCPNGSIGAWSTDEGLVISQIWAAIRDATLPSKKASVSAEEERSPFGNDYQRHVTGGPKGKKKPGSQPRPPPGPNPRRPHGPYGPHPRPQPGAGACYCYCPADQAIGRCIDNVASAEACAALTNASNNGVRNFCPKASLFYDCHDAQDDCPATLYTSMQLKTNTTCRGSSNASRPFEKAQQCNYVPTAYYQCYFLGNDTCEHNPYFPLPRHPPVASVTPEMFVI